MRKLVLLVILFLCSFLARAAEPVDTLRYSGAEVEKIFLENNLLLLAEQLNISKSDALIIQAGKWPNPTFTLDELQVYKNSTTDEIPPLFGNFWRDRNFAMQLEQLVLTAGKRKKNISLAINNREMAEAMLGDLLLALRAELRQTIADVMYLQQVRQSWYVQLDEVRKLTKAHENQFKDGYISEVSLLRLKALEVTLGSEIIALEEDMSEKQAALRNLLFLKPATYIHLNDDHKEEQFRVMPVAQLLEATEKNPQLKVARSQVKISESQLAIERAQRVPNLTFNSSFDRNGSVMRNFVGLGVSLDLPVFDRNKGNITAANHELSQSRLLEQHKHSEVQNAVMKIWTDLNFHIGLYDKIDRYYIERIDVLTTSVSKNFAEHNISMIEFLDYYESFRESKEKYYQTIRNILHKQEELSYLTGGDQ